TGPAHNRGPPAVGHTLTAAAQRNRHDGRGPRVAVEEAPRREDQHARERGVRRHRERQHALKPVWPLHPVAEHVGDVHYFSPGRRATMPTFSPPAALSASNTSIRS